MYEITDRQIEFIREDIRKRGIRMESLQHSLLDHICCMIENGLEPHGNFEAFYSRNISAFFNDGLSEIEQETITLLTFKNYYFMKKLMLFTGAAATVALTIGLLLKFLHLPGAAILIFSGAILLSLLFLPLLFVLKIREKSSARDNAIAGLGMFGGMLISLSVLFKMMHWPGANIIGAIALGLMLLVFLPVYFFTGIRNPETKVNTIVSSIFIFYGCALVLMLTRSQSASEKFMQLSAESVWRSEQILSEQQKQTAYLTAKIPVSNVAAGKRIFGLCENIKAFLIEKETGRPELGSGQALSEVDAARYFQADAAIREQIRDAEREIDSYNRVVGAGEQKIPSVAEIGSRKVPDAINSLIQAQMVVLQNQSAAALRN